MNRRRCSGTHHESQRSSTAPATPDAWSSAPDPGRHSICWPGPPRTASRRTAVCPWSAFRRRGTSSTTYTRCVRESNALTQRRRSSRLQQTWRTSLAPVSWCCTHGARSRSTTPRSADARSRNAGRRTRDVCSTGTSVPPRPGRLDRRGAAVRPPGRGIARAVTDLQPPRHRSARSPHAVLPEAGHDGPHGDPYERLPSPCRPSANP